MQLNPLNSVFLGIYESVVALFQSALRELGDPETANYDCKVAAESADYCESGLANGPPIPQISSKNDKVRLYSRIGCSD